MNPLNRQWFYRVFHRKLTVGDLPCGVCAGGLDLHAVPGVRVNIKRS